MKNLPAADSRTIQTDIIAPPTRGRFEGVLNVVRFNWPLYIAGFSVVAVALLTATIFHLPPWIRWALFAGSAAAIYLLLASLIVSYWIYDRSPLYRFDWAMHHAGEPLNRIINLHSGLDESSLALRHLFPDAALDIYDFYDSARMTEPSILRARRYQDRHAPPWLRSHTQSVTPAALPVADHSVDALIVILAIHEVRLPQDRTKLFAEIARVLRPLGRLLLVEHLRDPANFLAFGPQFVHFFSRCTWLDHATSSGLKLNHESRITPFIGFFVFEKPQTNSL